MTSIPRWLIVAGVALLFMITALIVSPPQTQATSPDIRDAVTSDPASPHANLNADEYSVLARQALEENILEIGAIDTSEVLAKDTCMHCHLSGEDTGIWTPIARWSIFGIGGLVFAFGMYRSSSTWLKRTPWKPITAQAVDWVDERYDVKEPWEKIAGKPVPKFARQWFYCLGGITLVLFLIQAATGIMLAFYYKPTPDEAYASIQFIEEQVRFGAAIRAIHHWAANGMVVMVIAHAARVLITGAYRNPRELNWVAGTLLLILTMGFGLTGYLLPWDQRAYWATTVATDIAGGVPDFGTAVLIFLRDGWSVTGATLSRFYGVHVFALPVATVALMGLHFIMIRRQGVAEPL